jgi:hypothetical protein
MPTLFANQVNKTPHNVDKHAGFHGSALTLKALSHYIPYNLVVPRGCVAAHITQCSLVF